MEERPSRCRSFECLWLSGQLRETDRPDKLGVMLVGGRVAGTEVVFAFEVEAGKLRRPKVESTLLAVAAMVPVVIFTYDGERLLRGRPAAVRQIEGELRERLGDESIPNVRPSDLLLEI